MKMAIDSEWPLAIYAAISPLKCLPSAQYAPVFALKCTRQSISEAASALVIVRATCFSLNIDISGRDTMQLSFKFANSMN